MKWIFEKIWAGITAFVSWIINGVVQAWGGRRVALPNEDDTPTQTLPQPEIVIQPPRPWITEVNGLVFYTKGGARELCFSAAPQPSSEQLRDVKIWIFPDRHPSGIEFIIVADKATRRQNHPFWPLVPSTEWYKKASGARLPSSLFPTNVSRIELREGNLRHTFLVSADQEWFYPADDEKRRCRVV